MKSFSSGAAVGVNFFHLPLHRGHEKRYGNFSALTGYNFALIAVTVPLGQAQGRIIRQYRYNRSIRHVVSHVQPDRLRNFSIPFRSDVQISGLITGFLQIFAGCVQTCTGGIYTFLCISDPFLCTADGFSCTGNAFLRGNNAFLRGGNTFLCGGNAFFSSPDTFLSGAHTVFSRADSFLRRAHTLTGAVNGFLCGGHARFGIGNRFAGFFGINDEQRLTNGNCVAFLHHNLLHGTVGGNHNNFTVFGAGQTAALHLCGNRAVLHHIGQNNGIPAGSVPPEKGTVHGKSRSRKNQHKNNRSNHFPAAFACGIGFSGTE